MHPKSAFRRTAFLSLVLVALSSGCGDSTAPNDGPDSTKSTITLTLPMLFIGDTVRATLQVRDARNNPITTG
ncbi:MAG TPA: hypothetical protein VF836_03010, partial [Gemmatimonadaceae bacterium]